jgi:hypothetical protein
MQAFIVPLFIFLGAFGCPAPSFVTIYMNTGAPLGTLDPTTLPDSGPDTTTVTPGTTVPYGLQVTPWTSSLASSEVEGNGEVQSTEAILGAIFSISLPKVTPLDTILLPTIDTILFPTITPGTPPTNTTEVCIAFC